MRIARLPKSTLVLLEYSNGFRLFCRASMALCEIQAKSWIEAWKVAQDIIEIWPTFKIPCHESKHNEIFLAVILSQDCNLSCQYCYLHGDNAEWRYLTKPNNELTSTAFLKNQISRAILSRPSKFGINFFGGEPLLQQQKIIDLSKFTRDLGEQHQVSITIGITSNGTLLNDSFLEWSRSECVEIMLSIDSPPDLHNRYRARGKSGASFSEILDRIQGFEEQIVAVTTITHKTPSLREACEPLIDYGFKDVYFNFVHTRNPELSIDTIDVSQFLFEFEKDQPWYNLHRKKIGNLRQIHRLLHHRKQKISPCSAGSSSYAIGPDCKIYFCHSCVGNPNFELKNHGRIFLGKTDINIISKVISSNCQDCWCHPICGGDCWLIQREYSLEERDLRCSLIRGLSYLGLSTYSIQNNEKP